MGPGDPRAIGVAGVTTPADRAPAPGHVSEDRWVRGGSKVGENGVRAGVPGERAITFPLIVKVLLLFVFLLFPRL